MAIWQIKQIADDLLKPIQKISQAQLLLRLVFSLPIRQADTGYHSVRPQNERFCFCTIQVITDTHAFHVQFPYDDWGEDDDQIRISNNRFGKSGFSRDIHTPEFHVAGSVHFGASPRSSMTLWGLFNIFHLCSAGTVFTVCITV